MALPTHFLQLNTPTGAIDTHRVCQWTQKFWHTTSKITNLLFPINHNANNWILIHLNLPTNTTQVMDSLPTPNNGQYLANLTEYVDTVRNTRPTWNHAQNTLPMQQNRYNCGLYTLTNAQSWDGTPIEHHGGVPSQQSLLQYLITGNRAQLYTPQALTNTTTKQNIDSTPMQRTQSLPTLNPNHQTTKEPCIMTPQKGKPGRKLRERIPHHRPLTIIQLYPSQTHTHRIWMYHTWIANNATEPT